MGLHELRSARAGLALALGVSAVIAAAAPASCLYPEYTFEELEPSGSGSVASVSSSSGGSAAENCLNGLDDDNDGSIDCADTDCGPAGYSCVAGIPLGWSGYQSLFVGAEADLPACPSQFPSQIPYLGRAMPMADPVMCATCGCDAPIGEACDLPDMVTVIEKTCQLMATSVTKTDLAVPAMWDGSCQAVPAAAGGMTCGAMMDPCNRAVKAAAPGMAGGSCAVSGGAPTTPAVVWGVNGKACGDAPLGGGCGAGEVCQPLPAQPFQPGLCIYKAGEQTCPGEPFTQQHVLYEDMDDTRACTECTCGSPGGGACTANITVYNDAACSTGAVTFAAGACANLSLNPAVAGRKAQIVTMTAGKCTASGGDPIGTVTPTQPTTFCCVP